MKQIESDFAKELSCLMTKYGKMFGSDKHGLFLTDINCGVYVGEMMSETASECPYNRLIFALYEKETVTDKQ